MVSVQEELRKQIEASINERNQTLKDIDEEFDVLVTRQEKIHQDIAELRGVLHSVVTAKPISTTSNGKPGRGGKRGPIEIPSDTVIRDWILKKGRFTQREFADLLGYSYTSYEGIAKVLDRFKHMVVQVQKGGPGGKPNVYEYKKP